MKRSGWYGDSWRHALAAKGMKSKYFAPKVVTTLAPKEPDFKLTTPGMTPGVKRSRKSSVPKTGPQAELRNLQAERQLGALRERIAKEQEPGQQLIREIQEGDLTNLDDYSLDLYSSSERSAIIAEANKQAVEFAMAGSPVPNELKNVISKETKNRINAIERERRLQGSAARQFNRELTQRTLETGEEAVRGGIAAGAAGLKEGAGTTATRIANNNLAFREATADLQKNSSLFDTLGKSGGFIPDISDNVFLGGDGDPGIGKLKDDGAFDFLSEPASDTAPLSSAIVPSEKFKGVDFGMDGEGGPVRTYADQVTDKVETLWTNRQELGKVDKAPLKKGQKAFERGDREKLVEAINEQEFQIKQQESRWKLVNQTRAQVESNANHEAALNKAQGMFGGIFKSSGGAQVAEQTRKINEVTKDVKQGADEARARAQVLRGNLQRLDATVPFDDSVPQDDVKIFKKEFSFADLMRQRDAVNEGQ